jgi:sugar phosphate isomerase/epimerase
LRDDYGFLRRILGLRTPFFLLSALPLETLRPEAGRRMIRTFSTLGCAELDLRAVATLAHRYGVSCVEIRALGGTTDLPRWLAHTYYTPVAWRAALDLLNLTVCAFGTSFRLIDGKFEDRAALLAYVPWAEAAGVPWLRVFDGGQAGDATEIARAAEVLAWWREERRCHGWNVDLMVETHDAFVTLSRLRAFISAVPDVAVLWDCHHTWKKGREDPVATWREFGSRIVHIHVKDSISRPSAHHPFTYILPGEGEFPLAPLLVELKSSDYRGALSLEWERLWHPYLPPLETALTNAAVIRWW